MNIKEHLKAAAAGLYAGNEIGMICWGNLYKALRTFDLGMALISAVVIIVTTPIHLFTGPYFAVYAVVKYWRRPDTFAHICQKMSEISPLGLPSSEIDLGY